ncbi:MAG: hypothetical protein LBE89_05880 [Helicobacteraceae bacterium]|nr:hypothetical protein [Helicobacteraceae bacterium]
MAGRDKDSALLELGVKLERWAKKNRVLLISAALLLVVWLAASAVYSYVEESRLAAANAALIRLEGNPEDRAALAVLKEKSPELHDLYLLSEASRNEDRETLGEIAKGDSIAAVFAAYQLASLSGEYVEIERFLQREVKALEDIARFQDAFLLLKSGEFDRAKVVLDSFGGNFVLQGDADMLAHYGAAAKQ